MGFNEDVSLVRIDPVTPTADNSINSPLISEAFDTRQTGFNYGNSHALNSSCSSNTSFFSTGSTGVHSTKCSPISDKLLNQLITSGLPKTTEFERRGMSKVIHEVSGLTTSKDHDLPLADAEISDSICLAPVQNKVAPLAQDEIGDRTICNNKNPVHMLPRIPGKSILYCHLSYLLSLIFCFWLNSFHIPSLRFLIHYTNHLTEKPIMD